MRTHWAIGTLLLCMALPSSAADLEVSSVSATAREAGTFEISFRLSASATPSVRIYDGRDLLVREITPPVELPPGDHSVVWDGRDLRGRPVPPEAYRFAIEARSTRGEQATWDLSDATGGESVAVREVRWNPDTKQLSYGLAAPARVRIRLGLADGPLLRTLLDWVPRESGERRESWDGRDSAAVLDVSRHPRLQFVAEAFALSRNTLIVGPQAFEAAVIVDLDATRRRLRTDPERRRMFDYAAQAMERRRDFPLRLEIRDGSTQSSTRPRVKGPVRIRVDVDGEQRARVLEERFEAVYYVDGQFVSETEVGFLPATWSFDPAGLVPGVHYLTVNLRGYDGHFGIMTLAVQVAADGVTPVSGNAALPTQGAPAGSKRTTVR